MCICIFLCGVVANVAAFWRNNKRKLQQCCPYAVFFTTIPKLDDDDTDIADEDELSCLFLSTANANETLPHLCSVCDDECVQDIVIIIGVHDKT